MTRKPRPTIAKAVPAPNGPAAIVNLTNSEGANGLDTLSAAQANEEADSIVSDAISQSDADATDEGQSATAPQDAVSEGQAQQAGAGVAGQSFPQVVTTAPAHTTLPTGDLAEGVPVLIVTCHQIGGRRRAGRRWQQGETTIPLAELSDDQIEWLRGDPLFMIREA